MKLSAPSAPPRRRLKTILLGKLATLLVGQSGPFLLSARLYWPMPAALDGRWGMPGIERLD